MSRRVEVTAPGTRSVPVAAVPLPEVVCYVVVARSAMMIASDNRKPTNDERCSCTLY